MCWPKLESAMVEGEEKLSMCGHTRAKSRTYVQSDLKPDRWRTATNCSDISTSSTGSTSCCLHRLESTCELAPCCHPEIVGSSTWQPGTKGNGQCRNGFGKVERSRIDMPKKASLLISLDQEIWSGGVWMSKSRSRCWYAAWLCSRLMPRQLRLEEE